MSNAPKVFVSHASEDKERFVTDFAFRLRERGIDAWLDRWEMLPGHSLVDKIFEEGIKNAHAVVVVVSKNSIDKAWVREELNAAMVKRINSASKLIPVVIDECEVPQCLRSIVWERIVNLNDYAANLDRIVLAVFGQNERPPLGEAPRFVRAEVFSIGDLTTLDSSVLSAVCDFCVTNDKEWIENTELLKLLESLQLGEEPFCDVLEILDARGYVELKRFGGSRIGMAKPTFFGFDEYLRATRRDYESIFRNVALRVVNDKLCGGAELLKATQLPQVVLNHAVSYFENKEWMSVSHYLGPCCSFVIHKCSAELRRWLQEQ